MTPPEVRALLDRLSAAYGRRPPSRAAVAEWERALRATPGSDAHATLDRLIDQGEAGPSLPGFLAHVRAMHPPMPTTVVVPDPDDSGPPGTGATERGRRLAAIARERLAAADRWTPPPRVRDDARGADVTGYDTERQHVTPGDTR